MQDGEAVDMDLNSDLKTFADGDDGVGGNLLKNYRLDINFDRDRITNLDNRSGMSVHGDAPHRQGGPPMQNFDHEAGFYGEAADAGGNVGSSAHPDSADHQIQMMQHRTDLGDAFQATGGAAGSQAFQRVPGSSGANYGNNQSTILEEAASNEEDGDQAAGDNESLEQLNNAVGSAN